MNNAFLKEEVDSITAIYEEFVVQEVGADAVDIPLKPYPQEDNNQVGLTLSLTGLAHYPQTSPSISLKNLKNIDARRRSEIEAIVNEILESHVGFEILYDLYTEIVRYLQCHNTAILSVHDKMQGATGVSEIIQEIIDIRKISSDDEDDSASSDSEPPGLADKVVVPPDYRITEQQFYEWKAKFKKEMIDAGIWTDIDIINTRPTGKQLFMTGMIKPADESVVIED